MYATASGSSTPEPLRWWREGEDSTDPEFPFVRWAAHSGEQLGVVDPNGLLERAQALLTAPRFAGPGQEDPCQSAF